jgi:FtsP/CotA-like multicopper oxidase with cupredoxin domain
MTSGQLIALDLLIAVVAAAAWLGAGAVAAAKRPRAALALFAAAVLATLARVGSVIALAGSGWWFVQEKVVLALPLAGVAGLVAVLLAGPRLVRAARAGGEDEQPGEACAAPVVVLPLLTAGYASVAGVFVTFLVGYPTRWSDALITVALVAAAVLLTWRFMAEAASPARRLAGVATLVTGLVGAGLAVLPAEATDLGGGPRPQPTGGEVAVTALRGPATAPAGGTVRRYTLTARTATVTLASGRQVAAWTFNGQVPGPPVAATEGDLIEVTLRNADIQEGVTLHWHGFDVPSGEDGVPGLTQDAVAPGQEFVYRFLAVRTGTFWYHTHFDSHRGVVKGLYGAFVVTPREAPPGLQLTLPVHTFGDATVLGDEDQIGERRVAPGTPVRLRLINTDSTPHRFTLSGTPYRLVAVDGTDLHRPGELSRATLRLAGGGRYDLAFTMPPSPVALLVDNDQAGGLRLAPSGTAGSAGSANAVADTAGWPELDLTTYGEAAPTPFGPNSRFDRRFTLVLDRGLAVSGNLPRYAHTINSRAFPNVATQMVRENDLVRLTVVSRGLETHPWHLHGHRVLVLSKDGRAVTGSPLWMDTFDVRPGEVWQVAFQAVNPGLWMNHCHNLKHADQGMALHLAYENVSSPFHGAHGG